MALFRLEKSQSEDDIREILKLLIEWLNSPEQASLNRAFAEWLVEVALPKKHPDTKFPEIGNLEGVNSMLAETIQGWYAQAELKGEKKGKIEGKAEGQAKSLVLLLETKFSSLSKAQQERIYELDEILIEKAMTYIFRASSIEDMFLYIDSLAE